MLDEPIEFRAHRAVGPPLPARTWREALAGERRALKRTPKGEVWRYERFILKGEVGPSLRRRIQFLLRRSRAHRFWRACLWLRSRGFLAPRPLAIFSWRGRDARLVHALASSIIPGEPLIQVLATGRFEEERVSPSAQHALARECGSVAAALARLGRANRDHKPSNLIVARADRWGAEVAIIDCIGLRRSSRERALARTLACLIIEPTGLGCAPRLALRARCLAAACPDPGARRALWRAIDRLVVAHGDPVPEDNPLYA